MTRLTVIAAARNEAIQAAEWLEHLHWVDDVIVTDTGSQDGTQSILEAGGARVLSWSGDELVHSAKNRAIEEVKDGWILDLDFDERVSIPLRREIEQVLRGDGAGPSSHQPSSYQPAAYRLPFRHYVLGRWVRHGGWNTSHIRLFRAGRVSYPEDRAHSTPTVDGEVGDLAELVLHFAHPTLHDFLVKMNRYTGHDTPLTIAHGRGGLRRRPPLPVSRVRWLWSSFSVFWTRYIKLAGFRDGMPGFLIAALMATYVFVEQAKIWESVHAAPAPGAKS